MKYLIFLFLLFPTITFAQSARNPCYNLNNNVNCQSVSSETPLPIVNYVGSVGTTSNVSVNLAGNGPTIPTNFVGFSFETSDLITGGYFQGISGSAASMISMMKLLGTCGSIRIGGASSDNTPSSPALTQQIADNLKAFMDGLGSCWQIIYGLDLKVNDPATAATQAGYLVNSFGVNNIIFQFGNEPELYMTPADYIVRWNSYYTAVSTAIPSVKVAAWDSGDFADTQSVISSLTPGLAGMSYVTQHYYSDPNSVGTLQHIFATLRNQNAYNGFYLNTGYAKSKNITQRMTETNTVANAGYDGISNRMGGAAWLILEQLILANGSWAGVNIHGFYVSVPGFPPNAQYNPLVLNGSNFGAGQSFYGMFMFSKLAGQQIVPLSIGGTPNIGAIATKNVNGNANILVVNTDQSKSAKIIPQQNSAWSTASVLMMKSEDNLNCSSANISVGGKSINNNGSWFGTSYSINNGDFVELQPCASALIQIQP